MVVDAERQGIGSDPVAHDKGRLESVSALAGDETTKRRWIGAQKLCPGPGESG